MRTRHPERKAMIKAIKSDDHALANHLKGCEECRELYDLLALCVDSADSIESPPLPESVYKSRAIALIESSKRPKRTLKGKLAHDSWAGLPPHQVRDTLYSGERCLRFKAGEITLELVIEKIAGLYEIVARVYEKGSPTTKYLLQIGQRKLYPENHECFYFKSKQPPKRLTLISPTTRLELGTLAW